jgi:hypothetical protein
MVGEGRAPDLERFRGAWVGSWGWRKPTWSLERERENSDVRPTQGGCSMAWLETEASSGHTAHRAPAMMLGWGGAEK